MSVEELQEVGMSSMGGSDIGEFLSSREVGVLSLPAEGAPYVVPLSFTYDGESAVYFTYLLGADSRKEELTESAELACFLVYSVDSAFQWESVLVSGPIQAVPREEWEQLEFENPWRPDLFEQADLSRGVRVYRLTIDERSGIKHTGLPPGFKP
jgi:nitroimidazol reductase NimA-like FMN-containing flavoprotein (pyridoxamine 5'-phosphate oxidase superfamily)